MTSPDASPPTFHLSLRGCARQPAFRDDRDRRCLLALAAGLARRAGVAVHAYALLDHRIHLLVSAPRSADAADFLRGLLACHRLAWRRRHGFPPPAWLCEGRQCQVDSLRQLLVVHRFIETLPVAEGLAAAPGGYRWSSGRASLGLGDDRLLSRHPALPGPAAAGPAPAPDWADWLARAERAGPRALGPCLWRDHALGAPGLAVLRVRLPPAAAPRAR